MIMTEEQFKEINDKLREWRDERGLTREVQLAGFNGNFFEEMSEFARAKNENERIDALADIVVFSLNAFEVRLQLNRYKETPLADLLLTGFLMREKQGANVIVDICFRGMRESGYDPYLCMLETIKEISSRTGKYDETQKKFVKDNGLYPDDVNRLKKCMTIENESDEWITFADGMDSYTYKKWYKADYSKCKL